MNGDTNSGWTALGDTTRRAIFEMLVEHPSSVTDLADALPVSRSAVSQHLKVLKEARLVADTAAGKHRIYRVDPDGLAALRSDLDRFWIKTLAAYKQAVEQPPKGVIMSTQADTIVRHSITVEAPIERAFEVFTEDFGAFKPREHNLLATPIVETVFEPRIGGNIYDRGADGSECRWANVLAYEPPHRLLLSWNITPQWRLETDPDKTSEWEVRFTSLSADRTRVDLEHRKLERHGAGWENVRDGVAADQGWPLYLQRYAELFDR